MILSPSLTCCNLLVFHISEVETKLESVGMFPKETQIDNITRHGQFLEHNHCTVWTGHPKFLHLTMF